MKQLFVFLLALALSFGANAAGLTAVADETAFLAGIDLTVARTIVLSVGAGMAVFGAMYYAIRKGLRMLGV